MTLQPTPLSDPGFAAFIGIDWADTKHDICLQAADSNQREFAVLPHRPRDIDEWACALRQRFHGMPVAVCIETSRGALVYALQKHDFLVLIPNQSGHPGEIPSGIQAQPCQGRSH